MYANHINGAKAVSQQSQWLTSLCPPMWCGMQGKRHVPYRDSKLTRLLQSSLSGNSYMAIITTISPAAGAPYASCCCSCYTMLGSSVVPDLRRYVLAVKRTSIFMISQAACCLQALWTTRARHCTSPQLLDVL
jgi:hypothetical protein